MLLRKNEKTNKKTLIAGAGNPYRHDDGIGIAIIQEIAETKLHSFNTADIICEILDVGTDGLSLLDILPNYDRAIIIDAVNMQTPPGTIKIFSPQEQETKNAKIKITADALSTHGFGLAEMLKLATELKIQTHITIIGIEPKDISFGEGLSDEIKATIPQIISAIKNEIAQQVKASK